MTAGYVVQVQQFVSVHGWYHACLSVSTVLQTVSYARFLLPTNALVRQKSNVPPDPTTGQTPMSRNWINNQKNFSHQRLCSNVGQEAGELLGHWNINNIIHLYTPLQEFHVMYQLVSNRCGRVVWLRSKPVKWSSVAMWKAQEGLNLWLLRGEHQHIAYVLCLENISNF